MRKKLRFLFIVIALALLAGGCGTTAENTDWASRLSGEADGSGVADEVQAALDAYGSALASKDRDSFLAVIDDSDAAFAAAQERLFDNLADVPINDYSVKVSSISAAEDGSVIAKVDIASTLTGSFSELPEPQRAAFRMVRKDGGWAIAGDATGQALGKAREERLEDQGKVVVSAGEHVIVLSHESEAGLAARIRDTADAAYPRLEETLTGVTLPKVPIILFDNMSQVDAAYPGGWQEWTGGASTPLGSSAEQGGAIIIDAGTYRDTLSFSPGYGDRMLGHELTHVALFPESGVRTPPFLVEGLADYIGGFEPVVLLPQKLRAGEPISPTLSDLYQPSGFSTLLTTEAATLAYEEADMAVEYLVNTYGSEAVLDLLRRFKDEGRTSRDQDELVDDTFQEVLGVSWDEFESAWRDYVLGS